MIFYTCWAPLLRVWYYGSCCGLKKVVLKIYVVLKVLLVEVGLEKYMFG